MYFYREHKIEMFIWIFGIYVQNGFSCEVSRVCNLINWKNTFKSGQIIFFSLAEIEKSE